MWCAAEEPGRRFRDYALLGDDIVIGDPAVAARYCEWVNDFLVKIYESKYITSSIGALEFAKKFRVKPVNVKMVRAATHSVTWMPVLNSLGITSLRTYVLEVLGLVDIVLLQRHCLKSLIGTGISSSSPPKPLSSSYSMVGLIHYLLHISDSLLGRQVVHFPNHAYCNIPSFSSKTGRGDSY